MTKKSPRKPPLVADKRYPSASRGAGSTPRAKVKPKSVKSKAVKPAARKRRPARKRKGGGGPRGFFRRMLGWLLGLIWWVTWRVGLLVSVVLALWVGYIYAGLPELSEQLDGRAQGSVTMLDKDNAVFAWRGDQFGGVITTETVSPHIKNAVIATEDKRFYRHFGVSPRGIASAVRINLSEGRGPLSGHGGSTITQQAAKLLCLGEPFDPKTGMTERQYEAKCRRGTLRRKVEEAVYALAMEVKYTKDEILTIYMNRAFLGAGARGFEAASQRYFGKSSANVTPAEAAMLAGLLVAPSKFAPTNNLTRAQNRADVIVGLMEKQGYLSADEAMKAREDPAELSQAAAERAGGYFADWVTSQDFPLSDTKADIVLRTTLDQRIQRATEEAMQYVFENKVSKGSKAQAAIVVMSADGAVRAMVGGRETRVAGVFNRVIQAKRQTGSAFKPFVYAAAMDLGYSPLDTVLDEPFCMSIPGSGQWCPKNYTNKHYGQVTLTHALKDSLNVPAVKVSERVGRDLVREVASQFGIDSDLALGPALALGASESTLLEMTGAYAGILNGGSAVTPYGILSLTQLGDDAPTIEQTTGIGERVIQAEAAEQLIWMMEKVVTDGSGKRAKLPGWQAAGKTGTTQAARDAWFIGFTAEYVTGVWMGYDDNTPLTGVTGGGLPAEIWHQTMARIHEGLEPKPLPMRGPVGPVQNHDGNAGGGGNSLGTVVDRVLRDIFGGGGGGNSAQPTIDR